MAAALSYLVRNAVSVAESTIRAELHLTLTQSAMFMAAFYWSYALLQVPSGWLAQQLGTRVTLALFAIAWSLASILIGAAPELSLLIVAQLLMGSAQAGVFPAACNSVAKWMPIARRSTSCAIMASGMQVGAILSSYITGPLLGPIGWRGLFLVYAIPGLLWAVWFWFSFRDTPQEDSRVSQSELEAITLGADPTHHIARKSDQQVDGSKLALEPTPWIALASSVTLWCLCGQQMARAAGYMFFASWFPTFMQQTRGVSINQSGYLQAFVFMGTLLGSLCGGVLTDWIFRRSGNLRLSRSLVGGASLGACGLLILGSWFVENVTLGVLLMAAGSVCAAFAGPCAFSATIDVGGKHVPQVFGVMNMAGNIAAAFVSDFGRHALSMDGQLESRAAVVCGAIRYRRRVLVGD